MMKVMHVLKSNSYSGAENVAITIINITKSFANSVYVSPHGAIDEVLKDYEIEHLEIQELSIAEIRRVVSEFNPDIIHAHDFSASIVCSFAKKSVPVISHIHNNALWIKTINLRSIAYALSCRKYKKIIGVSDSIFKEFMLGKCFRQKCVVINNPIDKKNIIKLAGKHMEEYDVGYLGRMADPKNPLLFVKIIGELKKQNNSIRALMIGAGELFDDVVNLIKTEGLNENINMVGFQRNPYALLNKCKTLCMPSKFEGFGLAAVEALTLGIPVVASNIGGLSVIVNDTCGFLCKDFADYINAFSRTFSDKVFYESLRKGAFIRSEAFVGITDYQQRIKSIYKTVVTTN